MSRQRNEHRQKGFSLLEAIIALTAGLAIVLSGAYLTSQLLRTAALNSEKTDLDNAKNYVDEATETDFKLAGNYLYNVVPNAASATGYTDEVRADSPIFWWRLNDPANSTSINDSSGNNRTGAIYGTIMLQQPGALNSDADAATTGASRQSGSVYTNSLGTPSGDFSVAWWLKPSAISDFNQVLITGNVPATNTAPPGQWFFSIVATGSIWCGNSIATALSPNEIAAGTVKANEWQFFVYTYTGGYGNLYLNGRLLARKPQSPPSGWQGFGIATEGSIDEISIYQSALSPERIRAYYIAGIAPPVPQDQPGLRIPQLPLARWSATGTSFQRLIDPISTNSTGDASLLLSADEQFSPLSTDGDFYASTGTLVTRTGTRDIPHIGDNLLVVDYSGSQSVLVRVSGTPQNTTGTDGGARWSIPVTAVATDQPAWNTLASSSTDISAKMPSGSTVLRLKAPVTYERYTQGSTGILARTVGNARQTLAFGVNSFSVQKTGASPISWTVSYEMESEQVESSTDSNYKQLATSRQTFTPNALNPALR